MIRAERNDECLSRSAVEARLHMLNLRFDYGIIIPPLSVKDSATDTPVQG